MVLPYYKQDDSFFGKGGVFEHACNAYPQINPEASRVRRIAGATSIAQFLKLLLGAIVLAAILLISSNSLYSAADRMSAEASEVFHATVASDTPAMGAELLVYELADYPEEYITVIEFSDGTRRYFYNGDDTSDRNEPSLPSDDPQVMAADE